MIKISCLKEESKRFYRVVDVDEDLFEERKGEAETLAGFILEISGIFRKGHKKVSQIVYLPLK
jgi:hypothetical protein